MVVEEGLSEVLEWKYRKTSSLLQLPMSLIKVSGTLPARYAVAPVARSEAADMEM